MQAERLVKFLIFWEDNKKEMKNSVYPLSRLFFFVNIISPTYSLIARNKSSDSFRINHGIMREEVNQKLLSLSAYLLKNYISGLKLVTTHCVALLGRTVTLQQQKF